MLFLSGDITEIPCRERITKGLSQLTLLVTLAREGVLKKRVPGVGRHSCFVWLMQDANIYKSLKTTLAGTYVCATDDLLYCSEMRALKQ